MSTINERFIKILNSKFDGNVAKFARTSGIPQTTLNNIVANRMTKPSFDSLEKLANSDESINLKWLITGDGNMSNELTVTKHHNPKYNEALRDYEVVPVYNIEAAANLSTIFENGVEHVSGYLTIPNMPAVDGAVPVRGDSMYPLLKSGDIVVYKKLSSPEYIIFGDIYIVEYRWDIDTHVVVKYINRSEVEGCVKLVSYNDHHEPMDVRISDIVALGIVKVSVRYNTIK